MQRVPGVISADLNFASGTLLVEYEPSANPVPEVVRVVEGTGHGLQSLEEAASAGEPPPRPWLDRYRTEVATLGSGLFSGLGLLASLLSAPSLLSVLLFAAAIAFGGLLVWRRALVSIRARVLDMNVLMTVAVLGAAALGEWGEGATVFFLFALGGLLESRSLERTRRSIRDLMSLAPETARVWANGEFVERPLAEVVVGDRVLVRPGERIPVDGTIAQGATVVDEAPITGESVPVEKTEGDQVFGGTTNHSGLIEVRATAISADSTLARIVYMVEEAQASRAPSQSFVDRFSRYYTPSVLFLAAGIAVVPPLIGATTPLEVGSFAEWIRRALVMLVVSCPCALVISTPVSVVSGITRASRDGVLVKGGTFLEAAAKVKAVAFDKTGTLTLGRPELAEVTPLEGRTDGEVLALAAALETHSNHPIARAVVRAAGDTVHPGELRQFEEVAGRGVSARLDGQHVEICSPACAEEGGPLPAEATLAIAGAEERGRSALVLMEAGRPIGVIAVADEVRPSAPVAISQLKAMGISHLVMLTGDNERVGEAVTAHANLTGFLARLLPAAKTDAVRVLQERYGTVAMVGDGVNDAPALAAADIGIAMGAAGSDTALETADVALMRDDLSALPGFFDLGRRTMRTIVANVTFSIAVKAVFLVAAITGFATLWMAVFADTGVSLLVILNGMRLLRSKGDFTSA